METWPSEVAPTEAAEERGLPEEEKSSANSAFKIADTAFQNNITAVYDQAWFKRKWVAQEVALAQEMTLHLGSEETDWSTFCKAMILLTGAIERTEAYYRDSPFAALPFIVTRILYRTTSTATYVPNTPYTRFGRRMFVFRYLQCKREHDHVYALMGLDQEDDKGTHRLFTPDYDTPYETMFVTVPKSFLQKDDPTILNDDGICRRGLDFALRSTCLPTWAPELREAQRVNNNLPFPFGAYNTALEIKASVSCEISSQQKISVHGILLDTVSFQWSEPFGAIHTLFFDHVKELVDRYHRTYSTTCTKHQGCTQETYWPTGEEILRAFAHTLGLDNFDSETHRRLRGHGDAHEFLELWKGYESYCFDEQGEIHFELKQLRSAPRRETDFTKDLTAGAQLIWDFHMSVRATLARSLYFTTAKGYMGCGPRAFSADGEVLDEPLMQEGDVVAIMFGMHTPFILRPVSGSDDFQLVGPCYVQGMMKGEIKRRQDLVDSSMMIPLV